jgi:hypothetical protein
MAIFQSTRSRLMLLERGSADTSHERPVRSFCMAIAAATIVIAAKAADRPIQAGRLRSPLF